MKRFVLMGFVLAGVLRAAPAGDWRRTGSRCRTARRWPAGRRPSDPESWVVEDGVFVSHGERSHLFYVGKVAKHEFRNFELSADVMTSPGANSGIYVHTKLQGPGWPEAGYELQVINSNPPAERMNGYIEHKMTGSVYAVRNTWVAPAQGQRVVQLPHPRRRQDHPDLHQRQADLRVRGTGRTPSARMTRRAGC